MLNMDCDKIQELLVGLRDGTLPQEEREAVERHVSTCVRCTNDLALIDEAFDLLRDVEEEDVPTHYFTNLLPRIHERIEQRHGHGFGFTLPIWLQRFLAPVSACAVLVLMFGMYNLFNPAVDPTRSHLMEIVAELPGEEIEGVAESESSSSVLSRAAEPSQRLMESISSPAAVSQNIERELVNDQLDHGHPLSIFLATEHPFEDITDEDVESVIKKLNDTSL
jgi:Putative zinc-finger